MKHFARTLINVAALECLYRHQWRRVWEDNMYSHYLGDRLIYRLPFGG